MPQITVALESDVTQMDLLMQDYMAEFTQYDDTLELVNGRYEYPFLQFYWSEPDRYPFLLKEEEETAGFALVRRCKDPENGKSYMEMAEFYVIPEYRRTGVGHACAQQLFREFAGEWEVAVMPKNLPALGFWKGVISTTTEQFDYRTDAVTGNHLFRLFTGS